MNISTKLGNFICNSEKEIAKILLQCSQNGYDDVWIGFENEFPSLAILINHEFACVHYFEAEGVFYQSEGNVTNENIPCEIAGELSKMPGYTVISLSSAIECAKEFFHSQKRLDSVNWNEL